ncbi:hypothetical protein GQ55_3G474500 [Panicum hallii var. hallii]|uniref:Nuclear transcription factor Y subunit n=1 Tax=Panicum hallii var. hallii TaxID=1504633 RepID=A0A2T7EJC2_9POAL|nr:hypothetical protein GQ55_3G474500 [Panicum hallii var. hallii]
MSVENNGSSEMGAGQPMAVGRKLLPPITPGGAPVFVREKQYDAIIRLRERRRLVKEARKRRALRVKKHIPRCPKGHFVRTKGNQKGTNGGIMVPFRAALRDCCLPFIVANGYQEVTTVGSELQSSTPAIGFNWPFNATNGGGEHVGEVMYLPLIATNVGDANAGEVSYDIEAPSNTPGIGLCWPFAETSEYYENIAEATSGSTVSISNPTGDFYWPVVATNEEENVSDVAYSSILNLESPNPTTVLRIMMGNGYNTDQVSEQFQNVARLQAPEFTTLLTVMNNAGYDEAADDGHYDVHKVMTKLEGW